MIAPPPVPELLVRPYVQLGQAAGAGRDAAELVFQTTESTARWAMEYRQGTGRWTTATVADRRVAMTGAEGHIVRRAALARLRSGRPVSYRLMKDGAEVAGGSFMAPKGKDQPYRFAVFGDCGIDTPAQGQIADRTLEARPDFLVMTGDLVYQRGRISEYRKNFWPYYTGARPVMESTLTVAAPGNHDILTADLEKAPDGLAYYYYWSQPLNGPVTDEKDKSATPLKGADDKTAAFRAASGPNFPRMSSFSFDYADAHWTFLDANPYVDWTDARLRKWLADDLAKARKARWRFVAFHQPGFHSSRSHQGEKQMRLVHEIFEKGGVDVVFAGHVHNYQRSFPILTGPKAGAAREELDKNDWPVDHAFDGLRVQKTGGVVYIVDGAGGAGLYNPDQESKPGEWNPFTDKFHSTAHSLSVVDVRGGTLTLRQIAADGRELDRWSLRARR